MIILLIMNIVLGTVFYGLGIGLAALLPQSYHVVAYIALCMIFGVVGSRIVVQYYGKSTKNFKRDSENNAY